MKWPNCNKDKMYMAMIIDNAGIPNGNEYFNLLVHDIKNCDVSTGIEAMSYLPPWTFGIKKNSNGDRILDTNNKVQNFKLIKMSN